MIDLTELRRWDLIADVIVCGAGGAGLTAAVMAAESGAGVLILEKASTVGGTTAKSSGGMWIPNNRHMNAAGIKDSRSEALRYMARTSRPHRFQPSAVGFGLPAWEYELLEVFYDHGAEALDELADMGALLTMPLPDLPNYYSELPEDTVPLGRSLCPATRDEQPADGPEMVEGLERAACARGAQILVEHRVVGAVVGRGRAVVGVLAKTPDGVLAIGARRAVIFASGGFTHSVDLRENYLPGPIFGGCAATTNEGDGVAIAEALGAAMRNMNQAWNVAVLLEKALAKDPEMKSTFNIVGDSILAVNRHGRRVLNEKIAYHEITAPMQAWDGVSCEYPNLLLFCIWDERTAQRFAGNPYDGGMIGPYGSGAPHVLRGETLEELAQSLDGRLERLSPFTGGIRLAEDFADALERTVAGFNRFAETGHDADFHRGESMVELRMHTLNTAAVRLGTDSPSAAAAAGESDATDGALNPTMHPLAESGPYYAAILAPGTLDTKGGPMTDKHGRMLDSDGEPIPGAYAVGNFAASPTAHSYWGAGATLGPIVTFAWLAGQHAANSYVRDLELLAAQGATN